MTGFTYLCNKGTGIKIFDTLEWKFKSDFDPTLTTPGVPKPIVDLIGGTISGKANVTAPKEGWQDISLEAIFQRHNEPIPYVTAGPNTTVNIPIHGATSLPTYSPSTPTHSPSSGITKGALAGIGVGAFIGLICISGLFYCGRRAFRGDTENLHSVTSELHAQRDPVEAQGYTVRQELSAGYQPPELMYIQGSKFVYSQGPDECQSQEHGD